MSTVTLSATGQVSLPINIRRRFGMTAGTRLEIVEEADGVRLIVAAPIAYNDIEADAGMLRASSRGKPSSLQDFDVATLVNKTP